MSVTCFVCEEFYHRDVNPAMTLVPCGHMTCKPCVIAWRKENNSCPQCRKPIQKVIINRGLMDLIEENNKNNDRNNTQHSNSNVIKETQIHTHHELKNDQYTNDTCSILNVFQKRTTTKDRSKEVIYDKCELVIYIIDNSVSMEQYNDGKIFKNTVDNVIIKQSGVLRWKEAASKLQKIAKYNISRKICASYYLLNPLNKRYKRNNNSWSNILSWTQSAACDVTDWKKNIDFVVIDPQNDDEIMLKQKYNVLIENIMSQDNVRGDTPLDVITRYFGRNLPKFIDIERYGNKAICYNIITDGEPNNRQKFENELRYLANNYNIFLTINLCTEDDHIVAYYNDLDTTIGKELSGFDVIDDLESEQKEIISAGNTFFIYSEDIHICRMSGCYSIIADLMDEEKLSVYHSCKLCNELCDIARNSDGNFPDFNDREKYIECLKVLVNSKQNVYDFANKRFGSIIDVQKLDYLIWFNQPTKSGLEYICKMLRHSLRQNPGTILVIAVLLFAFWINNL